MGVNAIAVGGSAFSAGKVFSPLSIGPVNRPFDSGADYVASPWQWHFKPADGLGTHQRQTTRWITTALQHDYFSCVPGTKGSSETWRFMFYGLLNDASCLKLSGFLPRRNMRTVIMTMSIPVATLPGRIAQTCGPITSFDQRQTLHGVCHKPRCETL